MFVLSAATRRRRFPDKESFTHYCFNFMNFQSLCFLTIFCIIYRPLIAMGRKERPDTNAQTNPTQYQTPKTPTTAPSSSRISKSTTTARRKSQNTITSSLHRSNYSRKPNSFSSSLGQQQSRLTQIDWVTTRRHPDSDDEDDGRLDYIEADPDAQQDDTPNTNTNSRDVIEISDDSENDADYRPAQSSRTRPARGVRFGMDTTKTDASRRRSAPKPGSAEKGTTGRRKSGGSVRGSNKKDKQPKERDKTLTQMDYVRRYLKIEPDDDVKLEYTYYSPKKDRDPESREAHRRSAAEALQSTNDTGIKRRRLTGELNPEETAHAEETFPQGQLSRGLVTPKKSVKTEIPSSQSPESPGFAVVSPSQFRGINCFPLRQVSPADRIVKEEQPGSAEKEKNMHGLDHASQSSDQAVLDTSLPNSPAPHSPSTTRNNILASDNAHEPGNKPINPPNTQRTIVYETDAESDYGDDLSDIPPSSQKQEQINIDDDPIEDDEDSQHHDSQELPPPVVPSGPDDEIGPSYPEFNLSSDASICYRRPHQSTQFPLEPIPPLNTQRMAELFPQEKESSGRQILTDTTQTQSSPVSQRHSLRTHPLPTQTQIQTQTQTQSQYQSNYQDLKTSTEIVPESSPVARQDSNHTMPHESCAHESVVQVESSQPADRLIRHAWIDQDSGPRGIMSGNQLLSSSVMESIPMPPLWMGSQDSVGEPYSEPGNE